MDVKQEYKNHLIARKTMSVISIIIWVGYFVYLSYRAITVGIQNMSSIYWVMGGVGIFFIAFEVFSFRICRKKMRELEQTGSVRPDGALSQETPESLAPGSDIELVTVASYTNEAIAEIAKERLIASGIDAMIDGTVSFYPDFNQMYPIELKVRKADLAAASELLAN